MVHSDRGGHHCCPGWAAICEANGLTRSMSRKGTSGDNARAEGFFGLLKCEFFHGRDWRGWSLEDFMGALDGWLRWFREGRISQALGWLTPDEHRLALGYAVWVQEIVRSPGSISDLGSISHAGSSTAGASAGEPSSRALRAAALRSASSPIPRR